jgi:ubiquinone/menaquinone biosynthesis C-methylase UbiE
MAGTDSEQSLAIWERIAGFWDDFIQEGNEFQKQLVMPLTTRLLNPSKGQHILDCCCGNGNYSRQLAGLGAQVVAFDGSRVFIERASARTEPTLSIRYLTLNATDESAMTRTFETSSFDSAVCSMALMDLPEIRPLVRTVYRVLKPGSAFVFSVTHPCFNSNRARMTAELVNEDGRIEQQYGIRLTEYKSASAILTSGILNQPEPHYMYHRPVDDLLREFFACGFYVDAYEEPAFPKSSTSKNAFSWAMRPEIPPVLIVRVRKPA